MILLFLPIVTAEKSDIQSSKNYIENNTNECIEPIPHIGLSLVFFWGKATVQYYDKTPLKDITIRVTHNEIKWLCLQRLSESGSAGSSHVVSLHNCRGFIGPTPIIENESIKFIFVLAQDIVITLP